MRVASIAAAAIWLSGCGMVGGSVSGFVLDPISKRPVENAEVRIQTKGARYVLSPCTQSITLRTQVVKTDSAGLFRTSAWIGFPRGIIVERDYEYAVSKEQFHAPDENDRVCICGSKDCTYWDSSDKSTLYLVGDRPTVECSSQIP